MKLPIRALPAALSLGILAASCGGKVVVDPPDVDVEATCALWCDAFTACTSVSPSCVADCVTVVGYAGRCAPEAAAWLACIASLPADQRCAWAGCPEELAQRTACTNPPGDCSGNECKVAGSGGMHCVNTCGANVYETQSAGSAEEGWTCSCILNGATVGTCTDMTTSTAGCCQGVFAGL